MSNTLLIAMLFGAALLMLQRTEKARRWLLLVFLVGPLAIGLVLWARDSGSWSQALVGGGIALAGNFLFWLLYGRMHPPGSSDSITVIGLDE